MSTAAQVVEIAATDSSPDRRRPRSPWIAAAVAILFDTTGLVYCGRLRRAVQWAIGFVFLLIAMCCLMLYLSSGRVAWIATALLMVGYKLGLIVDTVRIARRREQASHWYQRWWFYLSYLVAIQLILLGVVQVSRAYWREAFVIPAGSMRPTILAGDRILVDKLRYRSTPIRHGDVIVFWIDNRLTHFGPGPALPGRLCHAKRVVGLPGDIIEIRDEKLLRNGAAVDETYAAFSPVPGEIDPRLKDTPSTVVGDDELFVLGDNRHLSLDSRMFGCITREGVVGKVAIVFWSREVSTAESAPALAPNAKPESPEPPRRIRWERFGLRMK